MSALMVVHQLLDQVDASLYFLLDCHTISLAQYLIHPMVQQHHHQPMQHQQPTSSATPNIHQFQQPAVLTTQATIQTKSTTIITFLPCKPPSKVPRRMHPQRNSLPMMLLVLKEVLSAVVIMVLVVMLLVVPVIVGVVEQW